MEGSDSMASRASSFVCNSRMLVSYAALSSLRSFMSNSRPTSRLLCMTLKASIGFIESRMPAGAWKF